MTLPSAVPNMNLLGIVDSKDKLVMRVNNDLDQKRIPCHSLCLLWLCFLLVLGDQRLSDWLTQVPDILDDQDRNCEIHWLT